MITALYIHIPYCKSKCYYCDFLSFGGEDQAHQAHYIDYLCREIELAREKYELSLQSIYIGGGTPSILDTKSLQQLLSTLQKIAPQNEFEFTFEANPESLTAEKVAILAYYGVNRLSLGVQSLDEKFLRLLGRVHTIHDVENAVNFAHQAGISNINLDLMYNLPTQTLIDWQNTLAQAIGFKPIHLSAYQLQIEEGTYLAKLVREQKIIPPDDNLAADMLYYTREFLPKHGYMGYELSNYAKKGYASKHNKAYWLQDDYLGLGLGATSFIEGAFIVRPNSMADYYQALNKGELPGEPEILSRADLISQFIFMGLRLHTGIELNRFKERFGEDLTILYPEAIAKACQNGLAELTNTHFRLSERGKFLANEVMIDFLD